MKFIRKNGRIIPIKEKGEKSSGGSKKPASDKYTSKASTKKNAGLSVLVGTGVGAMASAVGAGFGAGVGALGGLLLKKGGMAKKGAIAGAVAGVGLGIATGVKTMMSDNRFVKKGSKKKYQNAVAKEQMSKKKKGSSV